MIAGSSILSDVRARAENAPTGASFNRRVLASFDPKEGQPEVVSTLGPVARRCPSVLKKRANQPVMPNPVIVPVLLAK